MDLGGRSTRCATGRVLPLIAFLIFSVIVYLPMHLWVGDSAWFEPDGFPLPIQTSRILLYLGYFLVGVGIGAIDLQLGHLRGER